MGRRRPSIAAGVFWGLVAFFIGIPALVVVLPIILFLMLGAGGYHHG